MGYGSPKTLTDTSVRNCKGDIREFAPTVMVGVPNVWELVKKGIIRQVEGSNPIVKNMFWGAMALKSALLSAGLPGVGVLDYVVFSKIKQATGGQLRIALNGGGPVARDTQRFISMCITPMVNGYGLTETCAYVRSPLPRRDTSQAATDGRPSQYGRHLRPRRLDHLRSRRAHRQHRGQTRRLPRSALLLQP